MDFCVLAQNNGLQGEKESGRGPFKAKLFLRFWIELVCCSLTCSFSGLTFDSMDSFVHEAQTQTCEYKSVQTRHLPPAFVSVRVDECLSVCRAVLCLSVCVCPQQRGLEKLWLSEAERLNGPRVGLDHLSHVGLARALQPALCDKCYPAGWVRRPEQPTGGQPGSHSSF